MLLLMACMVSCASLAAGLTGNCDFGDQANGILFASGETKCDCAAHPGPLLILG